MRREVGRKGRKAVETDGAVGAVSGGGARKEVEGS